MALALAAAVAAAGPSTAALAAPFAALRSIGTYSANDTLLSPDAALRGVEFEGDDAALRCVRQRLHAGRAVVVGALGGSISAGSSFSVKYGGSGAWLYHAKVAAALRAGGTPHVHHNGALPATGPAFFEHCLEGQLPPPRADAAARLVLVEFGVNTDGEPAAFERLLRKLLRLRPRVAVIVVNTHVWTLKGKYRTCWKGKKGAERMVDPEERAAQAWKDNFNFGDEDAIARLCKHYNVPLVSMRAALLDGVRAGRDPTLAIPHFMIDCKHPSGQGHTYLAQLALARLLHCATCAEAAASAPDDDGACSAAGAASPQPLPPPMYTNGVPLGTSRCVTNALLRSAARDARGFTYTDEGRGKFGWVGNAPRDEVAFCLFEGADVAAAAAEAAAAGATAGAAVAAGSAGTGDRSPRRQALSGPCADMPAERAPGGARHIGYGSAPSCAARRDMCGENKNDRLLMECPLTCGVCSPVGAAGGSQHRALPLGLWLAYLQSYEHMGVAVASCEGACDCAPTEIDAHAPPSGKSGRTSITSIRRVALVVRPPNGSDAGATAGGGCCRLRVRVQPHTSSSGHKFKVLGLLLAQADHHSAASWQPPGTKVNAAWTINMLGHHEAEGSATEVKLFRADGTPDVVARVDPAQQRLGRQAGKAAARQRQQRPRPGAVTG